MADVAQLALQIERRRLRTASRTLSTATNLLTMAARGTRVVAIGVVLAAIVSLVAQHGESWAREAADRLSGGVVLRAPDWAWQTWAAIIVASAAIAQWARRLVARG